MGEMIQVVCRRCRTPLTVAASMRGQTMYCPTCNSAVRIEEEPAAEPSAASPPPPTSSASPPLAPAAAAPSAAAAEPAKVEPERPRLRLVKDRMASGGGRVCPHCGAAMGEDHVVCGVCGWNTRTNRSMADVARRMDALRDLVSALTKLAVVAAAGWILWAAVVRDWLRSQPRAPEMATAGGSSNAAATNVATSGVPAVTPELEAAAREESVARMNERFPRIADGEETVVAMKSGRILRGRFERLADGTGFTIVSADGSMERHPFSDLQAASRLRCDDAYRAREIEREVDRKLGR